MLMYTTEMHKRTLTNKSASVLYHWMYRRTGIVHGRRMGSSPEKTIHYSLFTIHFSLKMIIGTLPAGFSIGSRKAKEAAISGVCSSDWEWFANRPPEEMPAGAPRRWARFLRGNHKGEERALLRRLFSPLP